MSKLDELKELRNSLCVDIKGIENYPQDGSCVVIANHSRLMDIFYLPMALEKDIVSLISARLKYKNELPRKEMVNKYLYSLPIEAHGGFNYAKMCLDSASKVLQSGIDVSIFPEGAYVEDQSVIYRGHTGAARILCNAREQNARTNFYLVPVAINTKGENSDLDSYDIHKQIAVDIRILEPTNYEEEYKEYCSTYDLDARNVVHHQIIDKAMMSIANALNKPYKKEYIELYPKGNVMFADGSTVLKETACDSVYLNRYQHELNEEVMRLIKSIK